MKIFNFIVFMFFASLANASVYKCMDSFGNLSYQQRPCQNDSQLVEEMKIQSNTASTPVKLTSKNKKLIKTYMNYDISKFVSEYCSSNDSIYSSDVLQSHSRFYEVAKDHIDAGRRIFSVGVKGWPANQMKNDLVKGRNKKTQELNRYTKSELDSYCDSHARKIRSITSRYNASNRGWKEGDVDPEGND
jgi:hypothetical protein